MFKEAYQQQLIAMSAALEKEAAKGLDALKAALGGYGYTDKALAKMISKVPAGSDPNKMLGQLLQKVKAADTSLPAKARPYSAPDPSKKYQQIALQKKRELEALRGEHSGLQTQNQGLASSLAERESAYASLMDDLASTRSKMDAERLDYKLKGLSTDMRHAGELGTAKAKGKRNAYIAGGAAGGAGLLGGALVGSRGREDQRGMLDRLFNNGLV